MSVAIGILPGPLANFALLVGAFGLLLLGAEIFTNSVEWLGYHLGVSESATGSLLAAVGTALPETMIPVIAILSVVVGWGNQAAADEVGVGAILGAPFMLATLAMFLVGSSVLYFRDRRAEGAIFELDLRATRRDLSFFVVGYVLAVGAAFVPVRELRLVIALLLIVLYVVYVRRTLASGELIKGADLESLHLTGILAGGERPFPSIGARIIPITEPTLGMVLAQTVIALLVIIAGAHLFVTEVQFFAAVLNVPTAMIALLLAPLATELPEKFNSIIWISENKDTLAMGNITGAMVFQGTVPAMLGIVFTSWNLGGEWGTIGFLNALSAGLALLGGGLILTRATASDTGRLRPEPFLFGGLLYAVFIAVLIYYVVVLGVTVAAH